MDTAGQAQPSSKSRGRLASLDALRGIAMFFLVGGALIFKAFAARVSPHLAWLPAQMEHAPWNSMSLLDLFFPMFLFAVGMAFVFSHNKSVANGVSARKRHIKIIRRGIILFLLGLVYNGILTTGPLSARYGSPLGRIGIGGIFASLIYIHTRKLRTRLLWIAGLLLFYWAVVLIFHAPDYPDAPHYSMQGSIVAYIDRLLMPGKLYAPLYDPEGIFGAVTTVAQILFGMVTAQLLLDDRMLPRIRQKIAALSGGAAGLVALGYLWGLVLPINKRAWSSSFVCFTSGIIILTFVVLYVLIDVMKLRRWAFILEVFGTNSIISYLCYNVLINVNYSASFLFGGVISRFNSWAPLLTALSCTATWWLVLLLMKKKKIYFNF